MIENQQKLNKIRQHIKETRLQLDIKGQNKKNADQKPYACPTNVFRAKISKEFDFQVFRNFGEIV